MAEMILVLTSPNKKFYFIPKHFFGIELFIFHSDYLTKNNKHPHLLNPKYNYIYLSDTLPVRFESQLLILRLAVLKCVQLKVSIQSEPNQI